MFSANSHWASKTIKEVGKVVTGTTPSKLQNEYYGGNIPFVTPRELGFIEPVTDAATYLTEEGAGKAKIIPENSVMVCCIGSLGKIGIAGRELVTNQQINSIIFDDTQVDHRYGFRFCETLKPLLEHIAPSTTIAIVNKSRFESLEIPLPPLAEQQRIAAILDQADALRTKRRAALAKLDTLLQATFLHMFGDPITNPMGWEVKPLSEVAKVKGGLQISGIRKNYPIEIAYLRVANVYRDRLALDEIKILKVNDQELKRTSLKTGDILVVEGHGNPNEIGRSAVWDGSIEPCVHQNHLIRVQANQEMILPTYMSNYLNSEGGRRQLIRAGKTTSGLNTINSNQVRKIKILVPPLQLQKKYLDQVYKIRAVKENHTRSLEKLNNLFHALQQRAFKGEL